VSSALRGYREPMTGKTAADYSGDYTDLELRVRLKEEIEAGDRGGRPGQWSARKSQLLTHEYEAQGGGYRHPGERTESQQHLQEWTGQDWHTADGDPAARDADGTARYLPDAAREARAAAELIDVPAPEARRRVGQLHGESQLDRAERAEHELGRDRKTVLEAIERQRES